MDKEFTLELAQNEAEFLNGILPKNHSAQIFQKAQRRRKAEKKLDEMFVAQFSLRPVKKVKKENQHHSQKIQKISSHENRSHLQGLKQSKNNDHQVMLTQQKEQNQQGPVRQQIQKKQEEKMKDQNDIQVPQVKSARSQRVSKPTEAYLQFQQETFKRKVGQRQEQKVQPKNHYDTHQSQQKQNPLLPQKIQIKESGTKYQGQKMELQKQPPQQKQKQHIGQNSKQKSQQHPKEPKAWVNVSEKKEKLQTIVTENHYNLRVDPPKKQLFQNQQNHQDLKQSTNSDKNLSSQNLQNSLNDMPKIVANPKELTQNEKKRAKLPGAKFLRVIYKNQQQPLVLKRCWRILQRLKNHKSSWPFRHPVDPQKQGVPDYFDKIKNPMDLKTIQKKLRGQKYTEEEQFYSDVNLMLRNSFEYNPSTTKYYKLTTQIEEFFNSLKSKSHIPKSSGRNSPIDDEQNSNYEGSSEVQDGKERSDSKQAKPDQQNDSKTINKQEIQDDKRRSIFQLDNSQSNTANNRKTTKVIITNQGPIRRDKAFENENHINKSNSKHQSEENAQSQKKQNSNEYLRKYAQVKEINLKEVQKSAKKEPKQSKTQQKKRLEESNKKQENLEGEHGKQKQVQLQKQPLRFGYPQPKITLIQRETLLYDILHIESLEIRNQIQDFLQRNDQVFRKFKHYSNQRSSDSNKQGHQMQEEPSNESYEFELRDLDPQSYKILRVEIDRLKKIDEESRKMVMEGIENGKDQPYEVKE